MVESCIPAAPKVVKVPAASANLSEAKISHAEIRSHGPVSGLSANAYSEPANSLWIILSAKGRQPEVPGKSGDMAIPAFRFLIVAMRGKILTGDGFRGSQIIETQAQDSAKPVLLGIRDSQLRFTEVERAVTEASIRAKGSASTGKEFGRVLFPAAAEWQQSRQLCRPQSFIAEATFCWVNSIVLFCKSRALARKASLSSVRPELTRMRPRST